MPSGRKRSTLCCGMMKQSRDACACACRACSCCCKSALSSGLMGVLETLCLGGAPPGGMTGGCMPGGLLARAVESVLGDRFFPPGPAGGGRSLWGPPIGGAIGGAPGGPVGSPLPWGGPFPFMVNVPCGVGAWGSQLVDGGLFRASGFEPGGTEVGETAEPGDISLGLSVA